MKILEKRISVKLNILSETLHKKIDWRKARKRELAAAFDENQRAVGMLNPMRDKK